MGGGAGCDPRRRRVPGRHELTAVNMDIDEKPRRSAVKAEPVLPARLVGESKKDCAFSYRVPGHTIRQGNPGDGNRDCLFVRFFQAEFSLARRLQHIGEFLGKIPVH